MSFISRVLVTIALVALALLAWRLRQVWLIIFGAVILAVVIDAFAGLLGRIGLGHRLSVIASVVVIALTLVGLGWFVGGAVSGQFDDLRTNFGQAIESFRAWLGERPFGPRLIKLWDETVGEDLPWTRIASAAGLTLTALFNAILIVVAGIYLAVERDLYRQGLVRLAPPDRRPVAGAGLDTAAGALAGWLKGQALSMLFVGLATGTGLYLIGAPLPISLGLVAGLLEFVPYFGPFAAGALAVLFAFTDSPQTALYVALLMLAVQQMESYVVLPLAQHWTVRLPPVLALVAVLVFGTLFGIGGVLVATPMMVVFMALTKKLYIEHYLESRPVATG